MGSQVSVPYRGAIFLNFTDPDMLQKWAKRVSVPYRGAIFLNVFCATVQKPHEYVSVPYRGAIFLNTISETLLVFCGYLPFCVANCFFWKYSFLWNEFLQFFPVFMRCVGNACKIPGFLLL